MNQGKLMLMVAGVVCAFGVEAVRPHTVYLVQHTHSDIGFARPQSEVISHYVEHIDRALVPFKSPTICELRGGDCPHRRSSSVVPQGCEQKP